MLIRAQCRPHTCHGMTIHTFPTLMSVFRHHPLEGRNRLPRVPLFGEHRIEHRALLQTQACDIKRTRYTTTHAARASLCNARILCLCVALMPGPAEGGAWLLFFPAVNFDLSESTLISIKFDCSATCAAAILGCTARWFNGLLQLKLNATVFLCSQLWFLLEQTLILLLLVVSRAGYSKVFSQSPPPPLLSATLGCPFGNHPSEVTEHIIAVLGGKLFGDVHKHAAAMS